MQHSRTLLVLCIIAGAVGAWGAQPGLTWFLSYSGGYTHYAARDLNDVMVALADQSAEQGGLNRYDVDQFDGHPRQALTVGALWRGWRLGVETEFWVETFGQRNVPFYLNRDLDPNFRDLDRVHCDMFRQGGFQPVEGGVAGCIDAQEIFTIVPLTLQLTREWSFGGIDCIWVRAMESVCWQGMRAFWCRPIL